MTSDPQLAPIRAMIERLSPDERETLLRVFHDQVFAPPSGAERRVADLGFLAKLLDELPQHPDEPPYVDQKIYIDRQPKEAPTAPSARRLVKRYGSWERVCREAFGLLPDGRNRFGHRPPGTPRGRPPAYTAEECIASVRECVQSLGYIPSSFEYHLWRNERVRQAKALGQPIRLCPYNTIMRVLAPERPRRGGWQVVIQKIYGMTRQP
jgi:hypothetical protein